MRKLLFSVLCLGLGGLLGCDCGDDDTPDGDGGTTDAPPADAGPSCDFAVTTLGAGGEGSPPPDGLGGEGDLEIRSDVLRAVFSAVDRPVGVAASGGTLMDLHLLGQDDHLNELSQLGGVSQGVQVAYTEVEVVEQEPTHVVVEVRGHVAPQPAGEGETPSVTPDPGTDIAVVTRYEFRCGEQRVWIDTTITNTSEVEYVTDPAFAVMDVMLWGDNSLIPFCPARGQGDECAPFDISNPLPGLVESAYIGSTGSVLGTPGTFAFYIDDPTTDTFIGVHDPQVSAFGFPVLFGNETLYPDDTRSLRRVMVVGDGADAASATDIALDALAQEGILEVGTVTGTVTPADGGSFSSDPYSRPLVVLATPGAGDPTDPEAWTPVTMVRVGEDGSFSARVPAGAISWELRSRGAPPKRGEGGDVAAGATLDLGEIAEDPLPLLEVEVRDITSGTASPLPARVVIVGADGTESPRLGPSFGGSPARNVVLTDGMGDAAVRVPPGTYDVYVTHGPWYTIVRERITVDSGTDATVSAELQSLDVIPEGFLTADFHVHSGASYDSSLPIDDRVRAFLAEGVDAIVSTEHDVIFDYAPALAAVEETVPLEWQGRLRTFVGLESTGTIPQADFPHTTGHHNAFPLEVVDGAHKNGAPSDEYVDVATLYERLRALPSPVSAPLVQLNHPRSNRYGRVWIGYFDSCGFDPTSALDEDGPCFAATGPMGTRPWDFDAMEVVNGPSDPASFILMKRDWYALLRQAPDDQLPIGTANGDSHRLTATAGYPVTVLRTDTALAAFDDAALATTVEGGAAAGSLGVFVWATAQETGGSGDPVEPGRTPLTATSGDVTLTVRLAAAPWIPVDELRVLVNGEVVERLSVADGDWTEPVDPFGTDGVVRYEGTVDVTVGADAFVTVEAGFSVPTVADLDGDGVVDATDNDGDGDIDMDDLDAGGIVTPAAPELLSAVVPGALPIAFTNPIYVDRDGDGAYTPVGTPLPE